MDIDDTFVLRLPPDEALQLLLDLERVTPCMAGAELGAEQADGARALGLNVRLGPMRFAYDGTVRVTDVDESAHRATLVGRANERRGQGDASATIEMRIEATEGGSLVHSHADVNLTGRAAQNGRGIVQDVAARLIKDFAAELDSRYGRDLQAAPPDPGAAAPTAAATVPAAPPTPTPTPAQAQPAKPLKGGRLLLTVLLGRLRRVFRRR